MSIDRRAFLRQVGAVTCLSLGAAPPQFLCRAARAAGDQPAANKARILVLVQLAGGNDGLNTVIPYGDDEYYKARPGIGVSKDSVLRIDSQLGLHPRMKPLKEVYDEGRLSIVQGVGYPNPNRSHFRAMDIWHTARPEVETTDTGWIGRALDELASTDAGMLRAMSLGSERLPLALLGAKVNVPNIENLERYRLELGAGPEPNRQQRRALIEELAGRGGEGASHLEFLRRTAHTAVTSAARLHEISSSYKPAAEYPATALGNNLKLVAQVIAGELGVQVFFVSLGGFDTHSQQVGAHEALLGELSSAVRAFQLDLQGHQLDDRVMLATFSEFGRRVKENGSLGTDHGAASQMFILNPSGKSGVHGQHPSLTDLVEGDLKFHTDFRSVYATLLGRWLNWPIEPVLGKDFARLDFI